MQAAAGSLQAAEPALPAPQAARPNLPSPTPPAQPGWCDLLLLHHPTDLFLPCPTSGWGKEGQKHGGWLQQLNIIKKSRQGSFLQKPACRRRSAAMHQHFSAGFSFPGPRARSPSLTPAPGRMQSQAVPGRGEAQALSQAGWQRLPAFSSPRGQKEAHAGGYRLPLPSSSPSWGIPPERGPSLCTEDSQPHPHADFSPSPASWSSPSAGGTSPQPPYFTCSSIEGCPQG